MHAEEERPETTPEAAAPIPAPEPGAGEGAPKAETPVPTPIPAEGTPPAAEATPAAAPLPDGPIAEITIPAETGPVPFPVERAIRGFLWGTGRRKTAVARVRMKPGTGQITVNGRPMLTYFLSVREREVATAALRVTNTLEKWDVIVNTDGGGTTSQAGAMLLGTARILIVASPDKYEPVLRQNGHLTRDSRKKERKKYGRRGARRAFQFSKR